MHTVVVADKSYKLNQRQKWNLYISFSFEGTLQDSLFQFPKNFSTNYWYSISRSFKNQLTSSIARKRGWTLPQLQSLRLWNLGVEIAMTVGPTIVSTNPRGRSKFWEKILDRSSSSRSLSGKERKSERIPGEFIPWKFNGGERVFVACFSPYFERRARKVTRLAAGILNRDRHEARWYTRLA